MVFVRLPKEHYDDIQEISTLGGRRGFGAVRVSVTIGATTWSTSVFPDSEDRSYILFIKKAIRQAEHMDLGDTLKVEVRVDADNM